MQLIEPFDATKHDPSQGGGSLPIGKYPVQAINSEIKATKEGDSGMLVYELEVLDGPNKGQTGPYRLNIYNSNPQAKDIAQRQLSALCHVTGVINLHDSAQLHGKPFIIEVGLQRGENAEKGYTEVKRVFDIQGNEPGKRPTNTQPAQTVQVTQEPAKSAWGSPPAAAQQEAPKTAWGAAPATQQPAAGADNRPVWAR